MDDIVGSSFNHEIQIGETRFPDFTCTGYGVEGLLNVPSGKEERMAVVVAHLTVQCGIGRIVSQGVKSRMAFGLYPRIPGVSDSTVNTTASSHEQAAKPAREPRDLELPASARTSSICSSLEDYVVPIHTSHD